MDKCVDVCGTCGGVLDACVHCRKPKIFFFKIAKILARLFCGVSRRLGDVLDASRGSLEVLLDFFQTSRKARKPQDACKEVSFQCNKHVIDVTFGKICIRHTTLPREFSSLSIQLFLVVSPFVAFPCALASLLFQLLLACLLIFARL